jgi:diguanylate cyclase (GGDEF)-like protein
MRLRTNFTVKASVSAAIALVGISFSLLAARSTYGLIYPSLRSLGRTTTSYLSTWNCKKTHELLSELTVHRLRAQGSHGHAGHADTVPAVDVSVGVYHPENSSVSDFHSLLPVSRKAAQIIASFLAGDKSVAQNHDHSTPKAASGHSSTSQSSDRLHKNLPIISSPNKYLSGSACEQLKHGLNPQEVIIHPLDFSQFRDIAQDPRPKDSWMLFLYGPWPDSTGKPSYSFAISKINPSYVEINGQQTPLPSLLPENAGNVKVQVNVVPIESTKTSSQLVRAFPFLRDSDNNLSSNKILPFANKAYSISSSVSEDSFDRASIGASLPFAVLGVLMSLAIAGLAYKLQSYFETRHDMVLAESRTDPLTKLPNRRSWDERLKSSELERLNAKTQFYVLVVDLNSFKEINDSLGHEYGDQLLQKTSTSLEAVLRGSEDFVARLGGDEFGLIFRGTQVSPNTLISRVKKQLEQDAINAAVGIGSTSPQSSIQDAWSNADKGMYIDKKKANKFFS